MAQLPDEVMPGNLISSEWINQLLAKLGELDTKVQQLSGNLGTGTITVPNVFGQTLATARAIITLPAQQLALGVVFDAFGSLVNVNHPGKGTLLVLSQIPAAGTKVNPGTAMSLVVAATPSATPAAPPKPIINTLAPSLTLPVGSQVEIKGSNFDPFPANNIITFGGMLAAGGPNPDSNSVSLKGVVVPTGIDGAPVLAGQASKPDVPIVVNTPGGGPSEPFMCTIAAPPAVPLSNISTITPSPAFLGGQMTITGTGFSTQANQNLVEFDNNASLRVQGSTPSQPAGSPQGTLRFNVTVPASGMGLDTVGADRQNVPIAVVVNGVKGNTMTTRIRNPNVG
jgi:hypothetical protein